MVLAMVSPFITHEVALLFFCRPAGRRSTVAVQPSVGRIGWSLGREDSDIIQHVVREVATTR